MYFDIYCWKDKVSMHGYIFEISPEYLNVIIQIYQFAAPLINIRL